MRFSILLFALALSACASKQPTATAAAAPEPALEEPEPFELATHCDEAQTYEDLIQISYFQFKVSEMILTELVKSKRDVVKRVTDLYLGRIFYYEPRLPESAQEAINDSLRDFQLSVDEYVERVKEDV